jgi:hypothetical protein
MRPTDRSPLRAASPRHGAISLAPMRAAPDAGAPRIQSSLNSSPRGAEAHERVLGWPPDEAYAIWCERPVSGLKADSAQKSVRHRF